MRWSIRRRRVLVDRLQYKLLGFSLIYVAIATLTFAVAAFGPSILDLISGSLSWAEKERAADVFLTLHSRVWPPVVIVCLFIAAHATRTSHRIAGPLYRLRQVLGSIGNGDLSQRVVLRSGDYLVADADALNEMLRALSGRLQSVRERRQRLAEEFNALERALGEQDARESTRLAEQLRRCLADLDAAIEQFRVSREGPDPPVQARDAEEQDPLPVLPS